MEVVINGRVMEVITKEYDFDGKKGTSFKVSLYSQGKLYSVSIAGDRVEEFNKLIDKEVTLTCNIYIKGSYSLKLL